ncbi:tetratricopeptide repeat protein [Halioxenophilus aromaticivorans]|uniref:Sel1 repeat family protein n=1 Tax=Halioxenophilus aromaticivorans TaxID=1306992 RepID=A0AAV3U4A1_9ALTE
MKFCNLAWAVAVALLPYPTLAEKTTEITGNELSYDSMIGSDKRMKCLYGYVASKSGDHGAAIAIFEDCIDRWDDVYSMIWLAQMHESGTGVPQSDAKAFELVKRGAQIDDEAGYGKWARYHYGKALYQGRGTTADPQAALEPLKKAAKEGVKDACDFLTAHGYTCD